MDQPTPIGRTIRVAFDLPDGTRRVYRGTVMDVFPKDAVPSEDSVLRYYGPNPPKAMFKALTTDRLIVLREDAENRYLVVPMSLASLDEVTISFDDGKETIS